MRIQRERDDDIRELIDHAAWSWSGPSPLAGQSRWSVRAGASPARHAVLHATGVTAAAACFTALVFGVSMAAASQSAGGAADSMVHLVSQVLPGAITTRSAPTDASPSAAVPSAGASAVPAPHAAARPAPSPVPGTGTGTGTGSGLGTRTPDPEPSDSPRPSASAVRSPGPSQPPDR